MQMSQQLSPVIQSHPIHRPSHFPPEKQKYQNEPEISRKTMIMALCEGDHTATDCDKTRVVEQDKRTTTTTTATKKARISFAN